jgi:HlyD family secretion protein
MSGTELMRIADLNRMEVEVEVNENDIVRVSYMDTALIEVDAYLGRKFKGVVTVIPVSANTLGQTTDQVTNFNVKILLVQDSYKDLITERNPNPFRPGMSATADIQTSRKNSIFAIPIQAVTTRQDTSKFTAVIEPNRNDEDEEKSIDKRDELVVIFVAKGDTAIMKPVETGIQDDQYVEILSGVSTEENIIVAPYSAVSKKLEDKSLVEIVKKEDLFKEEGKK